MNNLFTIRVQFRQVKTSKGTFNILETTDFRIQGFY